MSAPICCWPASGRSGTGGDARAKGGTEHGPAGPREQYHGRGRTDVEGSQRPGLRLPRTRHLRARPPGQGGQGPTGSLHRAIGRPCGVESHGAYGGPLGTRRLRTRRRSGARRLEDGRLRPHAVGVQGGLGLTPLGQGIAHRPNAVSQVHRALETPVRILDERALHELDEHGRNVDPLAQGLGVVLHHVVENGVHGVAVERLVAGEHLVEHRTQGEEVGAGVDLFAPHLLGGHVVGRPHHHPGAGHLGRAETRQAEVEDLHLARRLDVDVGGLDVAVDEIVSVGEVEPVRHLLHEVELLVQVAEPALGDEVLEVSTLEKLHGHEDLALLLAEVVDRDDVRVVEAGGRLGLAQEALADLVFGAQACRDGLDGHITVEQGIVAFEDLAHGPLTDLAQYPVLADLLDLHTPSGHVGRGTPREPRLKLNASTVAAIFRGSLPQEPWRPDG